MCAWSSTPPTEPGDYRIRLDGHAYTGHYEPPSNGSDAWMSLDDMTPLLFFSEQGWVFEGSPDEVMFAPLDDDVESEDAA
jgi:hypothetical protein